MRGWGKLSMHGRWAGGFGRCATLGLCCFPTSIFKGSRQPTLQMTVFINAKSVFHASHFSSRQPQAFLSPCPCRPPLPSTYLPPSPHHLAPAWC